MSKKPTATAKTKTVRRIAGLRASSGTIPVNPTDRPTAIHRDEGWTIEESERGYLVSQAGGQAFEIVGLPLIVLWEDVDVAEESAA